MRPDLDTLEAKYLDQPPRPFDSDDQVTILSLVVANREDTAEIERHHKLMLRMRKLLEEAESHLNAGNGSDTPASFVARAIRRFLNREFG